MKSDAVNAQRNRQSAVAVVSPGLLPIPPVIGGSVETVIQKMAETTGTKFNVDIYGPTHPTLPPKEVKGTVNYYRYRTDNYSEYFKAVRAEINKKKYSIIQVENRPLFIPRTKAENPGSKFICSLHSMVHTEDRLIRPPLTQRIFSQCNKVLVYSKFMADQFKGQFPQVSDRFHYIHLGTQPEIFKPRWEPEVHKKAQQVKKSLGIPAHNKVVVFAGRVIPKKGVHVLIQAMNRVIRQYPDCCLVIVGSGWFGSKRTSPYINELREKAKAIAGKIYFTNYVPPKHLPIYFALADIFVCPSQWDEPFGLVNVEAMASGVPVIASARGGIPEIVNDGVNGFLVRNEDKPDSFVKPLLALLQNPHMAKNFGVAGRERVEDYFNWDRAGLQMTKLYNDLLK